jgi:quercetin dioxygenase-like cupin family protein
MDARRLTTLSALLLGFAVAGALGYAAGQQSAPTETRGVTVMKTGTLDLSQELDKVQGRVLRLRVLSLEPGGVVSLHSHDGRPGVAYVLSGTLTEYRGDQAIERKAGDVWPEGKDVTHWAENKGSEPVVIVATDVFKQGM